MSSTRRDRPLKAILFYLLAVLAMAGSNALAWGLTVFIVLALPQMPEGFGSFAAFKDALKNARWKLHLARGIVGNLTVMTAYFAFSLLPMADTTVLFFTAPLFVALLSGPLLKEHTGPVRWLAILAGFAGVVILAGPTGAVSVPGFIAGLVTGLGSASVSLFIRTMGRSENMHVTIFLFLTIGTVLTGFIMPFVAGVPPRALLLFVLFIGLLCFVAQYLKTVAYFNAPAPVVSPFLYTMLLWSILFDIIFWQDMPDPAVLLGGALIVGSNLVIWYRTKQGITGI